MSSPGTAFTEFMSDDEGEVPARAWAGALGLFCSCVPAGKVGVVQQFGRFVGYQNPGCACYCRPIHTITHVSVAVRQIECRTDCKTKDNVTMQVTTAIQFRINIEKIQAAVFKIVDAEEQIRAGVDNVVRSSIPAMTLDESYSNKDSLCGDILSAVERMMSPFGFTIMNALVTDLSPDHSVLEAMNAINAARRQRDAAEQQGEAQKVLQVKAAEADAETKYLSGTGVARMRKAMAEGFKESMMAMSSNGLSAKEAMHMMITTQYLDSLKDFAQNPKHSAILVPHRHAAAADLEQQVRDGMLSASSLLPPGQAHMGR